MPAPAWQLGYFDLGRQSWPWVLAFLAAAGAAWRLTRRKASEAGDGRLRWALLSILLFTLVPGRPTTLRSISALAVTAIWALMFGAALHASARGPAVRFAGRLAERLAFPSSVTFVGGIWAIAFVECAFAALACLDGLPHVIDSTVYFYQAKLLAAGQLGLAVPPGLDAYLAHPFVVASGGQHFPMYPIGHALLLAPGHMLGTPWAMPAALVATALVLLYLWLRDEAGESTARLTAILGLVSPFLLVMGGDFMSHTGALAAFQLTLWTYARSRRAAPGRLAWALAAGGALGFFATVRPLTALGMSLPLAGDALWLLARSPRDRAAWAGALLLGCTIGLAPLAVQNTLVTGSPAVFPVSRHLDGSFRLGFGSGIVGNEHWPEKAVANFLGSYNSLQKYLFTWPVAALAPLILRMTLGPALAAWELLAFSCAGGLSLLYGFHYYQDLCFGPRYIYETAGLWLALTAGACLFLARRVGAALGDVACGRGVVALALTGFTLAGGAFYGPRLVRGFSDDYWGVGPALVNAVEARSPDSPAVIVVGTELWNCAFPQQPVRLDAPVVYALEQPDIRALRAAFQGRIFWRARSLPGGRVELERL